MVVARACRARGFGQSLSASRTAPVSASLAFAANASGTGSAAIEGSMDRAMFRAP